MQETIHLKLFATMAENMPPNAAQYPITPGITVAQLLASLQISASEAKLIFVNGVRAHLATELQGGERVGIFPPVGGG